MEKELKNIQKVCNTYKRLNTIASKVDAILVNTKCWASFRCVSNFSINDTIDVVDEYSNVIFSHTCYE